MGDKFDERAGLPSASFSIKYKCPGAWNLVQACKAAGLIGDDGGAAAESGTDIHRKRAGEDVALTDSQTSMVETLKAIEIATVDALYPGFILIGRERRLWLRDGLRPISSGKYDAAYLKRDDEVTDSVAIFDDKTGWLEVDAAERNLQMRDLAALWHFNHPETRQVDVAINQPHISHTPSIARYDYANLQEALELLRECLVQIANPDAKRTPGNHCKHCPARGFCDEAKDYGIQGPRLLLERVQAGEAKLPLGPKGQTVLFAIEAGYKILDQLWDAYQAIIEATPDAVPGWYISEGVRYREFVDYQMARNLLELNSTLTRKELDEASTFGVTEIIKAFCNRAGTTQKKAVARFNELLAPAMEWKQKNGSLKPIPKRGRKAIPR